MSPFNHPVIRTLATTVVVATTLAVPNAVIADSVLLVEATDFMHARYYSPNLGRLFSVDPLGGTVGSSQSWNRYSYVLNNPITIERSHSRHELLRCEPRPLTAGTSPKFVHNCDSRVRARGPAAPAHGFIGIAPAWLGLVPPRGVTGFKAVAEQAARLPGCV